jgi:hypothetical protein
MYLHFGKLQSLKKQQEHLDTLNTSEFVFE